MKRAIAVVATLGSVLLAACWLLLPERFAVNAPLAHMLFGRGSDPPPEGEFQRRVRVPDGFSIGIYADGLVSPRLLRVTPAGDLLVSTPRTGAIVRLDADADGDGRADGVHTVIDGLNRPHGLDFHGDWLYVAETDAVGRVRFDPETGSANGSFERVVTGLPGGGTHWTRTLHFGPDGWMYVSVGSSCNACEEADPRRAAILRFRPDGSGEEIYATGLRNPVGFAWRPGTDELYATDNGRDLLGDDFPPCELNRVARGGFYGWPYANGDRHPDPNLGRGREARIAESIPPVHGFRAHNSPLGIEFIRGRHLPAAYRGAALVALHGSWNRTRKDGYKVVSLHWNAAGAIDERDFATGFELDEDVIGRPVDVAEGPDGALYISDDYAGAIYRVVYGKAAKPPRSEPQQGRWPRSEPEANEGRPLHGLERSRRLATARDPLAPLSAGERASLSAAGAALYERFECAGCHESERAAAGVVVQPLAGLAGRYAIDDLAAFLAAPTPPMPVYPLSDAERLALAVYLLADHHSPGYAWTLATGGRPWSTDTSPSPKRTRSAFSRCAGPGGATRSRRMCCESCCTHSEAWETARRAAPSWRPKVPSSRRATTSPTCRAGISRRCEACSSCAGS